MTNTAATVHDAEWVNSNGFSLTSTSDKAMCETLALAMRKALSADPDYQVLVVTDQVRGNTRYSLVVATEDAEPIAMLIVIRRLLSALAVTMGKA